MKKAFFLLFMFYMAPVCAMEGAEGEGGQQEQSFVQQVYQLFEAPNVEIVLDILAHQRNEMIVKTFEVAAIVYATGNAVYRIGSIVSGLL